MNIPSNFVKRTLVFCLILSIAVLPVVAQQDKGKDKNKDKKEKSATSTTSTPSTTAAAPARDYGAIISNMRFREIGPAVMGGRINDIAVVESDPRIIYAATASGGIFKSINCGTSWTPIFDNEASPTIGDIAIAPSDPSIIWVGTGESNNRQSSSWGNGVYKSTDGGKTWQNVGLADTHHIARVLVHPTNPDVVYIAATGKLWSASKERGVYKTTDGGKTWQQVLFVNEDTGATDIAMDPQSPGTIYAAAYQRRRSVFGFNGSGAGSALYKSTDGGTTWKKLTNGLPYNTENAPTPQPSNLLETGRIAVEVYRKDPNIVYALVEHAQGGIFRSNDKGETWTKMSDTNPRPMYFSQVRIDPNNDQRIWIAGVSMGYSEDGGRTFNTNLVRGPHADIHGIWINPNDSNHLIIGTDGGINWTFDRGRTWDYGNTIALAQFYEIGVDMSHPYKICGGLQDNNTWCGPSMSFNPRGITNDDWFTIGGGDGFYAQPDPNDPYTVYAESQDGNLLRRDLRTGESKGIRPREAEGEKRFRFQWNSPIVISAFDSKTIYYGGNFLFKSTNRGDGWTKISPDLTTGVDRNTLQIMGKVPDRDTRSRHDGVQQFPTITTVSESPLNANLLWAGTDDGNLQVTRDGGANWKNVVEKVPSLPKGTYVSRVVASRHNEGTAYATFDGHRSGEFKVYAYMTTDFGETWKSIVSNLPQNNGVANVVREHPRNPNLLFVGTEFGAFASFDKGANWTKLKLNLPTVPVDDILVHPRENDLIFGTHGRSIWVLDDITPLEQMNETVANSDIHLFDPRPATMWRAWSNRSLTSDKVYYGANPPNGAIINFYLKSPLADKEQVRITIQDAQGQTVREYTCGRRPPQQQQPTGQQAQAAAFFGVGPGGGQCEAKPGVNRIVWDLRSRPAVPQMPGAEGQQTGFLGFLSQLGFRVDPGDYTVKIKLGDKEMSKTVKVQEDPRINFSAEDRAKKREALKQLQPLIVQASMAQFTISNMRTAVNNAIESWKRPGAPQVPDNVKKAAEDFLKKIDEAYPAWGTPPSEVTNISQAGPPLVERPTPLQTRVIQVAFAIEGYTAAPTEWEMSQIQILSQKVPEAAGVVRKLATEDLPALNKLMQEAGVSYITLPMPGGGAGRRPPM